VGRRKLPRHLTWLEAFVAAVETGSLEAAAKHLGLVRSVVSEHLRALEDTVTPGHALLERGPGRRLRLTAQGERLYASTNAPLHALDVRRLQDVTSPDPSLRIGLNQTLSELLLARLAERSAAVGLKLHCSLGSEASLAQGVQARQLDVALGFGPVPPCQGVASRNLVRTGFIVIAAPSMRLGPPKARTLAVKDLQEQPFVDWLHTESDEDANPSRFEAAGVSVHEVARVESMRQLYPCLRAYRACAIAPDLRMFRSFPGDLKIWRLREREARYVEVVALWPATGMRPEAAALLEHFQSFVATAH
jgi:DNA-binding transcriptional LysR family regulator